MTGSKNQSVWPTGFHGHSPPPPSTATLPELTNFPFWQAQALDLVTDAAFVFDANGRILYCNRAAETLYDIKAAQVIHHPFAEVFTVRWFHPDDEIKALDAIRKHGAWTGGAMHVCPKGRTIIANATVRQLGNSTDPGPCLLLVQDITARIQQEREAQAQVENLNARLDQRVAERTAELNRTVQSLQEQIAARLEAEEQLQWHQQILEKVFATTHVAIAFLDTEFNFIHVNRAYAQADHMEPQDFVGKNHFDLYPHEENQRIFRNVARTGVPYVTYAKPFVYSNTPHRGITYWNWSLHPVFDEWNQVEGLVLCLVDVSEQMRLQQQILEVSHHEQRRIGQDLHDGLGQTITGLSFLGNILQTSLERENHPQAPAAANIARLIQQALRKTRSLAKGLCPVDLSCVSLPVALEELAHGLGEFFDLHCIFEYDEDVRIDDVEVASHIYRIAQEAVNNAAKHGDASQVTVRLARENENMYHLSVTDNGRGLAAPPDGDGLGLAIMEYRARMIGGELEITSHDCGGVRVQCVFPKPSRKSKEKDCG